MSPRFDCEERQDQTRLEVVSTVLYQRLMTGIPLLLTAHSCMARKDVLPSARDLSVIDYLAVTLFGQPLPLR